MNILYLSYDGMTDPLGQSQVLPYLKGLAAHGYKIHLISFEKKELYTLRKNLISDQCAKNGIEWHPLFYTKKPPVLSTLYDLIRLKNLAEKLTEKFKFKIIHCRSQLTAMTGLNLAKKYRAKFIFDMRGFWVDERVEGNIWNLQNPLYRLIYNYLKKKEKELFIKADAVVSLTERAIPHIKLLQEKEIKGQIMRVIPCCVDIDFFNPACIPLTVKTKLKKKLNIFESDFVLSYLGAIGTWYLCNEMLDLFKRLLLKIPSAKFLFITREDPEIILNIVSEKKIDHQNIIIISAERNDVPALLSLSNASIFFIKPSFSKQASSPTKQGEIMSMGIPLICNSRIGDTDQIVTDSKSGVVCSDFSDYAYDEAISQLEKFENDNSRDLIREGAKKYFSLKNGVDSYNSIYKDLIAQE